MAVSDATFLDNIDTALNAIISGQAQSLSARERALTKLSIKELMELKRQFEERVETSGASDSGGGNVLVQFGERA